MTEATAQPIADGLTRKHKPTTDEVVGETEPMETLLKKREIQRDPVTGQFDRHGKTLARTQKKTGLINKKPNPENQSFPERHPDGRLKNGGARPGAGRPKGAQNKIPATLKQMPLNSLDRVGGEEYLERLAIENSSAYCSLLGKILPHTLAAASDSNGGKEAGIRFTRVIVWPDGHREIEGVTPKQLPAPQQTSIAHQPQVGENGSNDDEQS